LCLFDTASGRRLQRIETGMKQFTSCAVRFVTDATVAVVVDESFALYDARTGKETLRHDLPKPAKDDWVFDADITTDGSRFALGRGDGAVEVYDAASGKKIWRQPIVAERTNYFLAFSPDGKSLAVGNFDKTIHI